MKRMYIYETFPLNLGHPTITATQSESSFMVDRLPFNMSIDLILHIQFEMHSFPLLFCFITRKKYDILESYSHLPEKSVALNKTYLSDLYYIL